ncbi:homocysteine S-methyltransferase family protein [Flagellimonas sp.]|uniref:homocysteine S-methyltransferase family protein n=1 Tax=Flagellimonas sp. TaxID=2058762 RepID=UPI003BB15336
MGSVFTKNRLFRLLPCFVLFWSSTMGFAQLERSAELDGSLPSGETLEQAITTIDEATGRYPKYYMINCAHPTHFMPVLEGAKSWKARIQGLRANASCKSHAELDESTELDVGNKMEFGQLHRELQQLLPNLEVFGGCCGTDASHIKAICDHISMA